MIDVRRGRVELGWDLAFVGPARAPATPPAFTDGLWEFDVVELFLRGADPTRYVEVEAGVRGHWLVLAFAGVRQREAELREASVLVFSDVADGKWRGRLELAAGPVEAVIGPPPWRVLVTAVTGDPEAGPRSHVTWPDLPGDAPDFHQPEAWALLET